MKIASNAAIFSCCTGKCLAKCVQLNIYCSSMLKSSFVGAALLLQFDIEAFCFGYHLLVRLLFFFKLFIRSDLAQTIFCHFTFYGKAGGAQGAAAGPTHTMCPWLAGRSRRVRFCVHSIPGMPSMPFVHTERTDLREAWTVQQQWPVVNNGQRPGQVAFTFSGHQPFRVFKC